MSPPTSTPAIVTDPPVDGQLQWSMQTLPLRPIAADELLVRIVASGICHTDIVFSLWPADQIPYPKVLGHEGAGIVVQAGAAAAALAAAGDPVLLSFASCAGCGQCAAQHPAFCEQFNALNYGGEGGVFVRAAGAGAGTGAGTGTGDGPRGAFFGQSSFAHLAIVKASSVVNVRGLVADGDEAALHALAPLGCGFQTGVGTVDLVAQAGPADTVVVLGLGGVGLLAVLAAARLKKCRAVVGVDRVASRLALATELGATAVVDTTGVDGEAALTAALLAATPGGAGATIVIDTTGFMDLVRAGLAATANRGQFVFVGVPPADAALTLPVIPFLQSGKTIRGSIEGDAVPREYVPKLLQWHREGKLPFERLIKYYKAADFQQALADMKTGEAIKPVLLW